MTFKLKTQLESKKSTPLLLFYISGCYTNNKIAIKFNDLVAKNIESKSKKRISANKPKFYLAKFYEAKNNYLKEGFVKKADKRTIKSKEKILGSKYVYLVDKQKILETILFEIKRLIDRPKEDVLTFTKQEISSINDSKSRDKIIKSMIESKSTKKKTKKTSFMGDFIEDLKKIDWDDLPQKLQGNVLSSYFYQIENDIALQVYDKAMDLIKNEVIQNYIFNIFQRYVELCLFNWVSGKISDFDFYDIIQGFLEGHSKLLTYNFADYLETTQVKKDSKELQEFKQTFQNLLEIYSYYKLNNKLSNIAEWSSYQTYEDEIRVKNNR